MKSCTNGHKEQWSVKTGGRLSEGHIMTSKPQWVLYFFMSYSM